MEAGIQYPEAQLLMPRRSRDEGCSSTQPHLQGTRERSPSFHSPQSHFHGWHSYTRGDRFSTGPNMHSSSNHDFIFL